MADNLRYMRVGETLDGYPSDAHNAFFDTYKRVMQGLAPPAVPGHSSGTGRLIVSVINMSGAAIDAEFPILKLTKPVFTPEDRESVLHETPLFEAVTPAIGSPLEQIVVVQGPIGDEDAGSRLAVSMGGTYCAVNFTNSSHTHATPKASNTEMASGTSGARILLHGELPAEEDLPATVWAWILLGGGSSSTTGITTVMLNDPIDGATVVDDELVPESLTLFKLNRTEYGHYEMGESIEVENQLPDAVPVPDGKFKVGYCLPSIEDPEVLVLIQVSCATLDLPDSWAEET